jgi:CubicO group peptidase (beta-lactamase class C family)
MRHSIKYTCIFIICFLSACKSNNNKNSDLAIAEANLENVSQINFLTQDTKGKKIGATDFAKDFILNRDEFLTCHFTLENPLIHSLQKLAPSLTEAELLDKGSFQYSILVDNKIVYVENLNKGAGLPKSKTVQLEHKVPLVTPEPIDFWGWFMWLKFMKMGGGQDALSEGKHTLSLEIRPYLKLETLKVGELLAKGSIAVNVAEIPFDASAVSIQNIAPNSGWALSQDEFDSHQIEVLNKKIAQKRFENINGIVVIKDGELLIEEYFNGSARDTLHDPRSVGKTVASTLLGIAIEDNHVSSEDAKLKEFYNLSNYKNYSPAKDAVTLKSLLTMSSGFVGDDNDYDSPGNEELMYPTKDWVQFTLDLPMDGNKVMEQDFSYFTAGIVILGDIIHKSVPDGLIAYADEKLFMPLGITNYMWQYTPQKVGNTAGGIRLRAVDFAKYGQLYKNKGLWNGKQILTEDWVEKSLSQHVEQPFDKNGFYGYLFWNKTYTVNNKNYEVSFCSGNGGNKIFVFKDIPFVVVVTSSAYNLPYAHKDVDTIMANYILPAVLNIK